MYISSFSVHEIDGQIILLNQHGMPLSYEKTNEYIQYLCMYRDVLLSSKMSIDEFESIEIYDNRDLRVRKNRPKISKNKRSKIIEMHGNNCLSCGSMNDICIDHVIPIKLGGKNSIDNLQPLCRSCNSKKRISIIDYRKN